MSSLVEIDNRGIPPLAGICSYEEAARPGLSVDETVVRLKRYNYVLRRLQEIGAAHLPSTPHVRGEVRLQSPHVARYRACERDPGPDRRDARAATPSR